MVRKPQYRCRPLELALILLVSTIAGCSLRDDHRYNRYAPTDGDPTVLQRTDALMQAAQDALDNVDRRIENVVY